MSKNGLDLGIALSADSSQSDWSSIAEQLSQVPIFQKMVEQHIGDLVLSDINSFIPQILSSLLANAEFQSYVENIVTTIVEDAIAAYDESVNNPTP